MKIAKVSIISLLSLVIFSLLFAGSVYAKIDTNTIVGLWLFDEGKGDVAKDSSGNGNDGILMVKPKWVDGKFGKALEFDGSASYVNCGDNEIMAMNKELTVQFWIKNGKKMAVFEDRQVVVGKHYLEYEVGIYPAGVIHTYTSDGAGNYDEGINCNNGINGGEWPIGEWRHLAWTLKGTLEIVYVDGIKVAEFNKPHEGTKPGVHNVEIGRRVEGSLPLKGAVDEVLIANVAFTAVDIETCVKDGLEKALGFVAVSPAGKLAAYWGNIKTK